MKVAIENLYNVFRKYSIQGIFHCDCGCIDEDDVKLLASKSLRNLEENDLSSYHGSALYTWGNLDHYKHYLPRLFEIYSQNRTSFVGLFEFAQKLKFANWKSWNEDEVDAIQDFIIKDWISYTIAELGVTNNSILEYSFYVDFDILMNNWNIFENKSALKNFVNLLYYEGFEVLYTEYNFNPNTGGYFLDLWDKEKLIHKLEETFFEIEEADQQFSEKISFVISMIENINKEI